MTRPAFAEEGEFTARDSTKYSCICQCIIIFTYWLLFADPELHDQMVFASNNIRYELGPRLISTRKADQVGLLGCCKLDCVQLVWMIRHPSAPIIDGEWEATSPESWGGSAATCRQARGPPLPS